MTKRQLIEHGRLGEDGGGRVYVAIIQLNEVVLVLQRQKAGWPTRFRRDRECPIPG